MGLPSEVRSHHTVWVRHGGRSVAVRYAVDGDAIVCFGDDGLSGVPEGARVEAVIHDIHCGPPLVAFEATVRRMASDELTPGLLAEVVGHRPLDTLDEMRRHRRVLALA
jgi:hypothetical protein